MKAAQIYFNRFQTDVDCDLRKRSEELMKRKLLTGVFVDRFNLTCVKLSEDSKPVQVKSEDELLHLFDDDPEKYEKVSQILLGKCFQPADTSKDKVVDTTNDNFMD